MRICGAGRIIDMLAVVGNVDSVRAVIGRVHEVGWLHASEPGDEVDRRLCFCTPSIASRTHHLHVVEERSEEWRGWLAFRDYLRRHPDTAAEYEDLKRRLAAAHGRDPNDRRAYREGKADFI